MHSDSVWHSAQVRDLLARHDAGGLIRLGRESRGWRQGDLGAAVGCSASTVSRLETRGSRAELRLIRRAASAVGMPSNVLSAALGLSAPPATRVASVGPRSEEDPLRRRTLLATAGAAVPATLLLAVDEALAGPLGPSGAKAPLDGRLTTARALFDGGRHAALLGMLPELLGDAHDAARSRQDLDHARLSSCYALASQVLIKIGRHDRARLTADRATTYAELSGSPLAAAAAARELSIVLRHQDQSVAAQRLILQAAAGVESTGLGTAPQRAAYAQMLCTTSYTAARAGDRTQALAMIEEARRAARTLPEQPPRGRLFPLTPAAVDLYTVGVHWALGDAGSALDAGKNLRAAQFATAERRGRMHTDLARAWWQWGKPAETARELLAALRASPGEVRDRPAIQQIVTELASRHPRTAGVRELAGSIAPLA